MSDLPYKELVIQWKKEHAEIVQLATEIIEVYETNEEDRLQVKLEKLNELTTSHLMSEDIEFYKFSMLENSIDEKIEKEIGDFIETFEETKCALMEFLTKYTLPDAVYDKEFIDTFQAIVDVVAQRISYEENTLYRTLQEKSA